MTKLPSLSECNPGFEPFEFNVVVLAEPVVEERTAGGIILTQQSQEQTNAGSVRGLLVSVSPAAFSYHEWPDNARLPQPGDHVIFAKFGGPLFNGDDGREYRVCKDKDIMGVITPKG